ncbi:hypothetical protein [Herbaspirillum seropedicae]|uniref:hypothetical protein n=1 Tax=Herbaspirillum seropedicae TaxID=964 RepID=UPI000847E0A2|nr:hypothetical protein [Herbaspirillum seropedicae]AON53801.1 hypothetical protein Hsc_1498 [Herbaspirillum seropedicae]
MDKDFFKLSSEDTDLLAATLEKLRDDLRYLAEALDQAASEMEEEEALKFQEAALSAISKIKRRAFSSDHDNCRDAQERKLSYRRPSQSYLNIYGDPH